MALDQRVTIEAFLQATAAKQPTPGGGAVTAMAGALSAAIAEMVVNYSIGKKDLAVHELAHRDAAARLVKARDMFTALMEEDQDGYAQLTAARKLPAEAPDRQSQIDHALAMCVRGPQAMAATGLAILELCETLAPTVNRFLLSDLAIAAEMAMAAVRGGLYNVAANLADITDASARRAIEEESEHALKLGTQTIGRLMPAISQRQSAGK